MPQPPGELCKLEKGESGASDELRTAMEGMGAGGDEMEEVEVAEADEEDAENEGWGE